MRLSLRPREPAGPLTSRVVILSTISISATPTTRPALSSKIKLHTAVLVPPFPVNSPSVRIPAFFISRSRINPNESTAVSPPTSCAPTAETNITFPPDNRLAHSAMFRPTPPGVRLS